MLNLKKTSKDTIRNDLKKRGKNLDVNLLFDLYESKKELLQKIEKLNAESKIHAQNKDIQGGIQIKEKIKLANEEFNTIETEYINYLSKFPNILHESVPDGLTEEENIEIKRNGEVIFTKNHFEMGIFHDASEIIGSRFVILTDKFAKLHRALACFMMEYLSSKGFEEFNLPSILSVESLKYSGHLPKDEENMFKIEDEDKYLIPTSECTMVNLGRNAKWDGNRKFCAITQCFRKEAGSAGKDMKGLIRLHEFTKCEMVVFAQPDESYQVLESMVDISTGILDALNIPWRQIVLCAGDSPVTSAKTYDIEVPIGGKWREIASISNCTDYQSFNINAKNTKGELLHILNGSALAVGRTLATMLEVHYKDGIIKIPKVLHKYLNFTDILIS